MNHEDGFRVTIIRTERLTITRTIKREIRIEPNASQQKNTKTGGSVNVFVAAGKDAGIIKA